MHHRAWFAILVVALAWTSTPAAPTAAADLDGDGLQDLVVLEGSRILLLSADPAYRASTRSPGTAAFRAAREIGALPFLADLAVPGDFDGDGAADLAVAVRGSRAVVTLRGDGAGALAHGEETPLPGEVTALLAADVNRADGVLDWVVGVLDERGAALLVLESPRGALRAEPERIPLPAPATALAAGRFRGGFLVDVAAACGEDLVLLSGRDRRLHVPSAPRTEPEVASFRLPSPVRALAAVAAGRDLAVLDDDGQVRRLRAGVLEEDLALQDAADALPSLDPRPGTARLRLDGDGLPDLVTLEEGASRVSVAPAAVGATLVVDTTADAADPAPGDGTCGTGPGTCTLRAALQEANALAGADTIAFALGTGTPLLRPTSPLPAVTDPVSILGNTGGATRVALSGSLVFVVGPGLRLAPGSSGSLVRSLVLHVFPGYAVQIESADNVVEDCWLGTDTAGNGTTPGNSGGVLLTGATATGNLVGGSAAGTRNVLSRNGNAGARLEAGASGNVVQGNYVGTSATGSVALGNFMDGVQVVGGATANRIQGNVIGGNQQNGVLLDGAGTSGNLIEGNLLGLHVSGLAPIGNGQNGVLAQAGASSNTIGGTLLAQRNVVSGQAAFGGDGIELSGVASTLVLGNLIGLDAAGVNALPNAQDGVLIRNGSEGTLVGAATSLPGTAGGNVISGNGRHGIRIEGAGSTGTTVQGNLVGLQADGTSVQKNVQHGISAASPRTTVGGTSPEQGNVVSGNGLSGVFVATGGNDTRVQGNLVGTDVTGTLPRGNATGITVQATGVSVGDATAAPGTAPGNVVSGNTGTGIAAGSALVQGNLVGLDVSGTAALGNGTGISGSGSTLGGSAAGARNVVSGNFVGIQLASSSQVQGNWVGTDVTGTQALGNGTGILVTGSSNTIGGTTATPGTGPGNVVSGNLEVGISLGTGAPGANQIRGNVVGATPDGLSALPNRGAGITVGTGVGNVIGGGIAGSRNLISGNAWNGGGVGVACLDCPSTNLRQGNWIGVDVTGAAPLPNGTGVALSGPANPFQASLLTVGGSSAGQGNVISGNLGVGILVTDPDGAGSVQGNLIGTAPDGTSPMGNGSHGIASTVARAPAVGGITATTAGACTGACNAIRFNGGSGIHLPNLTAADFILQNRISDNAGLGIDLDGEGPTPNDPGDLLLPQNTPVITRVRRLTNTGVQGTVTSAPGTNVAVDVFGSGTADPSGFGEGDVYLGTAWAATDGTGIGSWALNVQGSAPPYLSAVASATGRGSSEFSLVFLDDDGDEVANTVDVCPQVPDPDQSDLDFDGHGDLCDCAPGDAAAFAAVTEVEGLAVAPDRQTVSWVSQVPQTGSGTLHQLLRGGLGDLPVGSGLEVCLASTGADAFADADTPSPGEGFWYVVRARNACGIGTYGSARSSGTCP